MDPAFFVKRNSQGEPASMIIIHVDDLMIAGCDDDENEALLRKLHGRFPFGEWDKVAHKPEGITYCGKEIRVDGEGPQRVVKLAQKGFVEGRLELIPVTATRAKEPDALVDESERNDFRSVLGSLQWLATSTRADISYHVNQLQKRVSIWRLEIFWLLIEWCD